MKRLFFFLSLAMACAVVARALEGGCFSDLIRVTALVNSGGNVKVGIVELTTSNSYFVSAGQKAGQIEVVKIDYEHEVVMLRLGTTTCLLALSGDPNAPKSVVAVYEPDSPLYRGEAIERFLRENPRAVEQGQVKFPAPPPPLPKGSRGETIDKFLAQNPEAARLANTPATGRGEGIERYLREHPEIKIDETPIPEGSMGPGIEAAMKKNPIIMTNTIPGAPQPPMDKADSPK